MILEGSSPDGDRPAAAADPGLRRHLRCRHRRLGDGRRQEDRRLVQAGAAARRRSPPVSDRIADAGEPRREGPQGGPAGPGGRRSRTSTTRSSSAACRWPSTAPTPRSCATSSRARSPPRRPRTRSPPSSSPPWAATRRPSASSAPSSGLVHVLENLARPRELGPLIAGAFVATLWGVLSANVFWLPMGAKITPHQRAAGRPDGAARRGHRRDPGRHQPARRPPEADRAPAARARSRRRRHERLRARPAASGRRSTRRRSTRTTSGGWSPTPTWSPCSCACSSCCSR